MTVFARLRKIPYYLGALALLLRYTRNPGAVIGAVFGRRSVVKFRNGCIYTLANPLDLLVLAESNLMDVYKLNELAPPSRVIDVGAGFGDFSILVAKKFPAAKVIAIEPDPAQFELLKQNAALNGCANIEVHQNAVGTHKEIKLFTGKLRATNSSVRTQNHSEEVTVKCLPLESFLAVPADALKIDCEGAELDILDSAKDDSLRKVRFYMLEYHNFLVPGQDRLLCERLSRLGLSCERVPDQFNPDNLGLIFARPRSP